MELDNTEVHLILIILFAYAASTYWLVKAYLGRFSNQKTISTTFNILWYVLRFLSIEFVVLSLTLGFEDILLLAATSSTLSYSSIGKALRESSFFLVWGIPLFGTYFVWRQQTKGNTKSWNRTLQLLLLFFLLPSIIEFLFLPIQLTIKRHYAPILLIIVGKHSPFASYWDFENFMFYVGTVELGNIFSVVSFLFYMILKKVIQSPNIAIIGSILVSLGILGNLIGIVFTLSWILGFYSILISPFILLFVLILERKGKKNMDGDVT